MDHDHDYYRSKGYPRLKHFLRLNVELSRLCEVGDEVVWV